MLSYLIQQLLHNCAMKSKGPTLSFADLLKSMCKLNNNTITEITYLFIMLFSVLIGMPFNFIYLFLPQIHRAFIKPPHGFFSHLYFCDHRRWWQDFVNISVAQKVTVNVLYCFLWHLLSYIPDFKAAATVLWCHLQFRLHL